MARKLTKKTACALAIVILSLIATQTAQITKAQNATNNRWALSFSAENMQNVTQTTFSPFDQIQLSSTVTYGNASVPDLSVTFKVQGPTGSADPINITTIAVTNADGEADSTFRLPAETENASLVVGTWQATATIQTSNGTLQESLSFTTQWNLQITSISIENQQGQNQTIFYLDDNVTVALTISDAGQPQQANITLNMQDASGQIINQTQIENTQINNGSTSPTQLQTSLKIPASAVSGEASVTAAIYSGDYQNTGIPAGENQTAYFTIIGDGGATPSPSPGPTKTPHPLQNSVSLFSWLLVATGLFTFTVLYMFLKRKPSMGETQLPNIPPTIPTPIISTPLPVQAAAQQETTQQSTAPVVAATASVATEKTFQATVADIGLTSQMQEEPVAVTEATEEPTLLESIIAEEPTTKTILSQVDRIQSTTKRIQAIKAALDSEKEQFAVDLAELNRAVDERERAVKNYLETMREEVGKLQKYPINKEENAPENKPETSATRTAGKSDLESTLSREIMLKSMSTYQSKVSSLIKRMEALKLVLKLEREQLGGDFEELNKAVDNQEKTIRNHFNMVRAEIEKLKENLEKEY